MQIYPHVVPLSLVFNDWRSTWSACTERHAFHIRILRSFPSRNASARISGSVRVRPAVAEYMSTHQKVHICKCPITIGGEGVYKMRHAISDKSLKTRSAIQ